MPDDIDDLLRTAMKTLDDQVPSGYFEGRLEQETLSRLEGINMQTTTGTGPRTEAQASTGVPPRADAEREEDSGLHDIRSMASSTKMRLSSRRSTQNPVMKDDDILASSSAGWKAVALPEPAKMVSLPELADSMPSSKELERQAKAAAAAEKAAAAQAKAAEKRAARDSKDLKAAASASAMPAISTAVEASVDRPVDIAPPMIGARIAAKGKAPKQAKPIKPATSGGGSKTAVFALVGLGLAAAAGGVFYLQTQKSDETAAPVAMSEPTADTAKRAPLAPAREFEPAPVVEPIAAGSAAPVEPPPVVAIATDEPTEKAVKPTKTSGKGKKAPVVIEYKTPDKKVDDVKKPAPTKEGKTEDGEPSFEQLLKEAGVEGKKEQKKKLDKKELSGTDFKKGMGSITGKAQACYAGNQGTAAVKIVIAPSGQVQKVTVTGQFAGTPVAACVEAAVKGASFPAWDGGPQSYGYSFLLAEK